MNTAIYIKALAEAGRVEDAKREYALWVEHSQPPKPTTDRIARLIALAEERMTPITTKE